MDKKLAERLMTANTEMGRQFRDYIMAGINDDKAMEILTNALLNNEEADDDDELDEEYLYEDDSEEEFDRKRFIEKNQDRWLEIGQGLERQREEMDITLTQLSDILGTSRTRIRKFEKGEPVKMAEHLRRTYQMALDHIRQTRRVDVLVELTNKLLKKYQEKAFIN